VKCQPKRGNLFTVFSRSCAPNRECGPCSYLSLKPLFGWKSHMILLKMPSGEKSAEHWKELKTLGAKIWEMEQECKVRLALLVNRALRGAGISELSVVEVRFLSDKVRVVLEAPREH